jgi:arylsulfatase A-like enzyme
MIHLNVRHIVSATVCAVTLAGCSPSGSKQERRPNIIVIMTDDHTTQAISCYGSALTQTPNLDRIAKEGMRFDNCYVSNAVSGPSRACILTGKLSHINGFTDNSQTFDGDQPTFPKLLHEAGYQTAMIGKWHLNSDPQGFDWWSVLIGQGEYYSPDFKENGKVIRERGYVTDIITEKAINFIEHRDPSKPFAMLYYHKAPHRNWMPAPRHMGIYNDTTFPEPATLFDDYANRGAAARETMMEIANHMWPDWDLKVATHEELEGTIDETRAADANKADVAGANRSGDGLKKLRAAYNRMSDEEKALWDRAYADRIHEYRTSNLQGRELVSWKYQQYLRDYLATCKSVDENVGRLLDYLAQIGELDNTIVVYTSDQGFFLGEHGWFDKRFMYEECQRTPLLVRYPKAVKAGSVSKALCMNIDFAPTFLDMAGIAVPADMQGRSLRPILEHEGEQPKEWRKGVYYHYYEYPSWHMVKRHYGVRNERYKLIHFYNDADYWELFDLQEDPHELVNRYDDPAYANVRNEMMQLLTDLQTEYKDLDPTEQTVRFFTGDDGANQY